MRKFHPSVTSSRFGTSPHSSLEPKYTVKVPSWFSFTLDEFRMQFSLFMKPSLPYTVIDQNASLSGTL
jgi:hypothetical protein